jgi:fumarate reductase flavoprotein subunit
LFVAGEDSGGVHGANRLGGNGVANSTVFGGIAGDTMARSLQRDGSWREPVADAIGASLERAMRPLGPSKDARSNDLEAFRERLYATMWDDAGIVRDTAGLARAATSLGELADGLGTYRLPAAARERAFNMTWHDWINLSNLIEVSQVIVRAAQARENSRGAHFRADFPEPGDLGTSTYVRVRARANGELAVEAMPVAFTRVAPGQSLV